MESSKGFFRGSSLYELDPLIAPLGDIWGPSKVCPDEVKVFDVIWYNVFTTFGPQNHEKGRF